MTLVCTMPGRFGDVLWSLATVRALAERYGEPARLYVSAKYGDPSFLSLIREQDYIWRCEALEDWVVEETAPMTPREPPHVPGEGGHLYHLGYREWPTKPLPYFIAENAGVKVDLTSPWVRSLVSGHRRNVAVGWSAEWKELKNGLTDYLSRDGIGFRWLAPTGSPYIAQGAQPANWLATANRIGVSKLFLGDLSAMYVLAVAMGVPVVAVEPEPMRHHEIFWVDLEDGEGRRMTRLVKGHDGKPTFDWFHVRDAVKEAWEEFS